MCIRNNLLKNHETSPSTLTWKWKLLKNVVSDQFTRYSRIFWHENSNLGNVNFLFGTIYHCIIRHRLNFGAKFKLRNLNMNWKSVELVVLVEKAPIVWIYLSVFRNRYERNQQDLYLLERRILLQFQIPKLALWKVHFWSVQRVSKAALCCCSKSKFCSVSSL